MGKWEDGSGVSGSREWGRGIVGGSGGVGRVIVGGWNWGG